MLLELGFSKSQGVWNGVKEPVWIHHSLSLRVHVGDSGLLTWERTERGNEVQQ